VLQFFQQPLKTHPTDHLLSSREQDILKGRFMGWNNLSHLRGALFEGVGEESYVYFVHNFFAEVNPATIAT
jgi:imidazoleglycerol phosphate synthase glutamine amidotransferase subunit HisH